MDCTRDGTFRFCPYCGESLGQLANIPYKYCPYCGQSLSVVLKEEPGLAKSSDDKATLSENWSLVPEKPVSDKVPDYKEPQPAESQEYICEETATTKTEEYLKEETKKETEKEPKETLEEPLNTPVPTPAPVIEETKPKSSHHPHKMVKKILTSPDPNKKAQYYSIVLKSCFHKDNLGYRLEKIFVRDFFAIRLALDNMPSVIVYKSKVASMAAVIREFYLERAAISIIIGDFNLYTTIDDKYSGLRKLPADVQNLMYSAPSRLWMGDKVYFAARAKMLSQTGVLVVTDQGLYFLDNPGDSAYCRWLIVPYYRVEKIDCFEDENGSGLLVSQKSEPHDIYPPIERQKFYIMDQEQLKKVLDLAQLSLESGNYRPKLLVCCPKCNLQQNEILEINSDYNFCPECNTPNKLFFA